MGQVSFAMFLARIVWARVQSRVRYKGVGLLEREAGQYLNEVRGQHRTDARRAAKPSCELLPIRHRLDEVCDAAFDAFHDAVELPHELSSLSAQALACSGPELDHGVSSQQQLAQLMLLAAGWLIGVQVGCLGGDVARDQGGIGSIGLAALANRLAVLMNPARVHHEDCVTALDELAGE